MADTEDVAILGYSVTIVRPGDRVLLTTANPVTPEQAQALKDRLTERFPGAEFSLVVGISGVAIEPKHVHGPMCDHTCVR